MSREAKILNASSAKDTEITVSHYEAFGWELISLNGTQITMSRETQNPVYTDLVKYQAKYEALKEEAAKLKAKADALYYPEAPKSVAPIDFGTCLLTFILCVFPLAIYLTYKILQKKKYKETLALYNGACASIDNQYTKLLEARKAVLAQMEDVVTQSRVVFFSKQS